MNKFTQVGTPLLTLGRVVSIELLIVICSEGRGEPWPWPRMIGLGGTSAADVCTAWHQLSFKCWVHLFSYRLQFASLRSVLRIAQQVTTAAVCVLVSSMVVCFISLLSVLYNSYGRPTTTVLSVKFCFKSWLIFMHHINNITPLGYCTSSINTVSHTNMAAVRKFSDERTASAT